MLKPTGSLTMAAAFALSVVALAATSQILTVWQVDSLTSIAGHPVTVVGQPKVVEDAVGKAVEFNGASDGLFVDVNPVEGLQQFTVEVVFKPDADGPPEQRFLHFAGARRGQPRAVRDAHAAGAGSGPSTRSSATASTASRCWTARSRTPPASGTPPRSPTTARP